MRRAVLRDPAGKLYLNYRHSLTVLCQVVWAVIRRCILDTLFEEGMRACRIH
jgi:hypothetical protein